MAELILHRKGVYNIYSTTVDAPLYERGFDLETLYAIIRCEHGQSGVDELPERLARAHATGSSRINGSLRDVLRYNYAGPNQTYLPSRPFIRKYLTL